MRRLLAAIALLLITVSSFGANFYWKDTFANLDAIAGKADGDRGVVITSAGNTTYYYHTGGNWVAVPSTFPIIIDNVVATDNILLYRVPRAITLTRADCYASVDNVVGNLMECSTSDVTSCSVLDAWTVTNAVDPFTDSSMTDGAVAAGAWLRWSTTSVGTASMNRLTCTVQYRE
jgi:hypothetical protein